MENTTHIDPRLVNRERILAEALAERDQQLLMAMDEIMSLRNHLQALEQRLSDASTGKEA